MALLLFINVFLSFCSLIKLPSLFKVSIAYNEFISAQHNHFRYVLYIYGIDIYFLSTCSTDLLLSVFYLLVSKFSLELKNFLTFIEDHI